MPFFEYKARDPLGKHVAGLVEAPTDIVAAKLLRNKRLFIISLAPQSRGIFSTFSFFKFFERISSRDVTDFTRQVATLTTSGLSVADSLHIIRSQAKSKPLVNLYVDIEHHLVTGGNLANALGRHPNSFKPIFIALVRAGEATGTLDKILERLADTMEDEQEIKAKIIGALIYPAIIILGMIVITFVMMIFVMPKLNELYADFGVTLPLATQLFVGISNFFVSFWWLMIITAIGALIGFSRWVKTPLGKLMLDSLMLKLPIFGTLTTNIILAQFTQTMAMLTQSGIHILDTLHFLHDSTSNAVYKKALSEISELVGKGFSLSDSFGKYEIFPPNVTQMIKVGEETGKIDEVMGKLALYFKRQADHMLKNLTTAIEPIIMIFLGFGVGFIVYSIITPIYSLTSQLK